VLGLLDDDGEEGGFVFRVRSRLRCESGTEEECNDRSSSIGFEWALRNRLAVWPGVSSRGMEREEDGAGLGGTKLFADKDDEDDDEGDDEVDDKVDDKVDDEDDDEDDDDNVDDDEANDDDDDDDDDDDNESKTSCRTGNGDIRWKIESMGVCSNRNQINTKQKIVGYVWLLWAF
jgi:hypothetical protein